MTCPQDTIQYVEALPAPCGHLQPGSILQTKQANPAADVSAQQREIDDRAYRLYGLTREEIKIVEATGQ